ncbi:hypothetical protein BDN71DRAFT_1431070 [Pleurotus eryngii]|uniref:Uncharacterized protein n=1 Tax=Pleurotus eryngii TaxID=5323 RepID=A0A9P6D8K2_PLEER|nr:hypothetical protein BDN71DRAFT_1431070 [Pleurotus eryngii]
MTIQSHLLILSFSRVFHITMSMFCADQVYGHIGTSSGVTSGETHMSEAKDGRREEDRMVTGEESAGEGDALFGMVSKMRDRKLSTFFLHRERRFKDGVGLLLRSIAAEDEGDVEEEQV